MGRGALASVARSCRSAPAGHGRSTSSSGARRPEHVGLRSDAVYAVQLSGSRILATRNGLFLTFMDAVTLSADHGDIGMVSELVQKGGNGSGVWENGVPVAEGEVGGDEDGS